MSRKRQIALQCQLLTGSDDREERICPCFLNSDCRLTEAEREKFSAETEVKERKKANWESYQLRHGNNRG